MLLENLKNNKDTPINTAVVAGTLCLIVLSWFPRRHRR